jgi:hypothetical protein
MIMKQLYNTSTDKPVGKIKKNGGLSIFKDSIPGFMQNIIELDVVFLNPPEYDKNTQKLTGGEWSADLENLQWRKTWQIIEKTELEIIKDNWKYNNYSKRIVCPIQLVFEDIGVKMYAWFQLNNLPVYSNGEIVELYCNEILPEHQQIVDGLSNIIQIQDKPE